MSLTFSFSLALRFHTQKLFCTTDLSHQNYEVTTLHFNCWNDQVTGMNEFKVRFNINKNKKEREWEIERDDTIKKNTKTEQWACSSSSPSCIQFCWQSESYSIRHTMNGLLYISIHLYFVCLMSKQLNNSMFVAQL